MYYIKSKFLLVPILFLAVLFVIDKVFLLPEVRSRFIQTGGMIYYQQRKLQLNTLKELMQKGQPPKKTVVILGDSRSLSLGELTLIGKKSLHDKYDGLSIFNFSTPQALPAYYAHLTQKIFIGNKRPKYLIIGLSPDSLNQNAGIMVKPVMSFGLPDSFIQKYKSVISEEDMQGYENTKRFALAGLGISLKTFRDRLKGGFGVKDHKALGKQILRLRKSLQTGEKVEVNHAYLMMFYKNLADGLHPNMSHYSIEDSPWRYTLDMARGAYYGWVEIAPDRALKKETHQLESIYFKNFIVSQSQLYFVRKMLEHAQLSGTKVLIYWPRVNPHLRNLYKKYPQVSFIWSQIERMAQSLGATSINMNQKDKMKCDSFYDASHMSALCAFELQEVLLDKIMK